MKFLKFLWLIFLEILMITFSQEDLPVHCMKHDIAGIWIMKTTDYFEVKSGHEMKCGHDEPSREETSYKAQATSPLINEYKVILRNDDNAEIIVNGTSYSGRWTMVYDEGFDMIFQDYSFFAFSKYINETSFNGEKVYKSQCYSTCTGWYTNIDNSKRGCYQAFKTGVDPFQVTYVKSSNNLNAIETSVVNVNGYPFYNIKFKSLDKTIFHSQYKLSSKFKNHALYIDKLNQVKKHWVAELHPKFFNKSIRELNQIAGRFKFKSDSSASQIIVQQHLMHPPPPPPPVMRIEKFDLSMFPKQFDWKHLTSPAISQGNCGSCYAISTVKMIEVRLQILYNHAVSLSTQHVLDCSYYNQGCNGGYPFLVMKFANEFEMIPESCHPYVEMFDGCKNSCDIQKLSYKYQLADYYYVGGAYGKCNEKLMMEELYNHGPFVVSFEPDYNFMMYKSGIYHSLDSNTWLSIGVRQPEWEKVDHSVLLVGWGEDAAAGKFWILQNTWGANWGEGGYFRMRRGIDDLGVESLCEAGVPVIIEQRTERILNAGLRKTNILVNHNQTPFHRMILNTQPYMK